MKQWKSFYKNTEVDQLMCTERYSSLLRPAVGAKTIWLKKNSKSQQVKWFYLSLIMTKL